MTWVLDTCVLLDLACNDKMFADSASRAIQSKLDDALKIFNPAAGGEAAQ